jgi:hypothetical protein
MQCPKCNGPVLPATKTSEKSPDFVCANENCKNEKGYRSGVWNNKGGGAGGARKWQPKPLIWKSSQLGNAYAWAYKHAEEVIIESSKRTKIGFTTADILNGAATLFIAIAGNVDPRPPAPPAPPTQAPAPQTAKGDANDDDIPF